MNPKSLIFSLFILISCFEGNVVFAKDCIPVISHIPGARIHKAYELSKSQILPQVSVREVFKVSSGYCGQTCIANLKTIVQSALTNFVRPSPEALAEALRIAATQAANPDGQPGGSTLEDLHIFTESALQDFEGISVATVASHLSAEYPHPPNYKESRVLSVNSVIGTHFDDVAVALSAISFLDPFGINWGNHSVLLIPLNIDQGTVAILDFNIADKIFYGHVKARPGLPMLFFDDNEYIEFYENKFRKRASQEYKYFESIQQIRIFGATQVRLP